MRNQSGFTLIELVLVIIILGILAAVAVPRFINLSSEAQAAALQGTVGAIDSASAINYAAYQVSGTPPAVTIPHGTTCTQSLINSILQQPLDANKYTISSATLASTGTALNCLVTTASPAQSTVAKVLFTN